MRDHFPSAATLYIIAVAFSNATLASEPLMRIKSVHTAKPLAVFSEPGKRSQDASGIQPQQFSEMTNLPVLEEKGSYIKIRLADGNQVWILSEKVHLERSATCGGTSPADVVTTVKRETNAPRGIGEACAKGAK